MRPLSDRDDLYLGFTDHPGTTTLQAAHAPIGQPRLNHSLAQALWTRRQQISTTRLQNLIRPWHLFFPPQPPCVSFSDMFCSIFASRHAMSCKLFSSRCSCFPGLYLPGALIPSSNCQDVHGKAAGHCHSTHLASFHAPGIDVKMPRDERGRRQYERVKTLVEAD